MSTRRTIIVGGGLAGLSAAHTALENGATVILLDKKPSLGGNSVKASSGINGAGTEAQKLHNIEDSPHALHDTIASARDLARTHLIKALTENSVPTLDWLTNSFGVDLSLVAQLGGHSVARTHRGKGGAPGWAMTSALVKKLEAQPERATILKGAKVTKLLQDETGRVTGVEYDLAGEKNTKDGAVVIATGGFAADYTEGGYLSQFRPELLAIPTTNGDHATGDGHRLAVSLGGALCDMDQVQVHPTGFVDPKDPGAKTKFLAAEALRGVGGILINQEGSRFVDELERRDFVTEKMQEVSKDGGAPIRLLLNPQAAKVLEAHIGFYKAKGLMREYESATAFAQDTNVPLSNLKATFEALQSYASGTARDPFGKSNFTNSVYALEEPLLVAEMTPVVHYTMGGIVVDEYARVLSGDGLPIPGLFAAGEAIGGVHGRNRLGGSSLLEAVVFGRIAGKSSTD
ncbi:FAD binding domain-containing protein [Daedaleopsis nitida]|nr:FAD binding domain-containing protein [Daedaleopsis nitida]